MTWLWSRAKSLWLCQPRGKQPQEVAKSWDQETAAWHRVCERTVKHVLLWQGDDKPLGPQEALILNELWMGLMDYLSRRKGEWIRVLSDQGQMDEESTINRHTVVILLRARNPIIHKPPSLEKKHYYVWVSISYLSFSHSVCVYDGDHTRLVRAAAGATMGSALLIRCPWWQCTGELGHDLPHHCQARLQRLTGRQRHNFKKI